MTMYESVVAGIIERLATIPGFARLDESGHVANILDYEPAAVHDAPLCYVLFDTADFEYKAGIDATIYHVIARFLFAWQDNQGAEHELMPLVDGVRVAIIQDPQLGGRIPSGFARLVSALGGYTQISGVTYRALECSIDATVKTPRGQ